MVRIARRQPAARATRTGRVGVLGTQGTVGSGAYQKALEGEPNWWEEYDGSDGLIVVGHDRDIGQLHHRRVRVLVHRDDEFRAVASGGVLDRAADPEGEEDLRPDQLARLADQRVMPRQGGRNGPFLFRIELTDSQPQGCGPATRSRRSLTKRS